MWHFLFGYVILQIEGLSITAFLRRIAENGIEIRDAQRDRDANAIRCTIDLKHARKLHRIRSGLPVRIRIIKRGGFPFLVRKAWKRPVLMIGFALMLITLFIASTRIWFIRIEGTERVDPASVHEMMKDYGLQVGARPKGAILIEAANDMSVRIRDAAWIGFDREGVTLKVKVVEAIPESEKHNTGKAGDIVADKDGVITELTVLRGQAKVAIGDRVKVGDILISGTVQWKDASYQTEAEGLIKAAVHYESSCVCPSVMTEAVQRDESETVRSFCIGPYSLMETKPSFEQYRLTEERTIRISDRFPICCVERTAQKIELIDRHLSEDESQQAALINAREEAMQSIPKNAMILNQYGSIQTIDGITKAVVIITAEETIGRTEEYLNGRGTSEYDRTH